jgi:hypothetical protein
VCIVRAWPSNYINERFSLRVNRHYSYVFAEVERSENSEYKIGRNMLTIADCHRKINLEFSLGTPKARKESLSKLKLLQKTPTEFGEALTKEANLNDAAPTSKERSKSFVPRIKSSARDARKSTQSRTSNP